MNDDELGRQLGESIHRRVRSATPRVSVERLLEHTEVRFARQRRHFAFALVAILVLGATAGFLIGRNDETSSEKVSVAVLDDGTPPSGRSASGYEPRDLAGTTAEIGSAFHAAFDGSAPTADKLDAIQDGAAIQPLFEQSSAEAEQHGYSREQLAGSTITILDTSFIDATHAVVRFSITIPGHGQILSDRIGYAIQSDGRWRVALRTVCDLLSLDGLGRQCPPGVR